MTKESQKLMALVGVFVVISIAGLFYLKNRDRLASNHYKFQALKKCEDLINREECEEQVERQHIGCYDAFIVDRDGNVDGYARCMGMSDTRFKR